MKEMGSGTRPQLVSERAGLEIDWKAVLAAAQPDLGQTTAKNAFMAKSAVYPRATRAVVATGVGETIFGEYANHRPTARGSEEIGWLLLGVRDAERLTVLATLPAGSGRDAGQDHVRFNADAQAVGSRILRRGDKRLAPVGVAHTHPGTLRRPSRGDFLGDRDWVRTLRGGEGVFAIGTADGTPGQFVEPLGYNAHSRNGLRFDWFGLATGDEKYHPLPFDWTFSPDLGVELRRTWATIEVHAARVENIARQLPDVVIMVAGEAVVVNIPVAGKAAEISVILSGSSAAFVYTVGGRDLIPDLPAGTPADVGVFRLLAEMAGGA